MRFRGALLVAPLAPWLAAILSAACAAPLPHADNPRASLHARAAPPLPADPTVRDVRFVPVTVRQDRSFGEEPGGGRRTIEDGVRLVTLPGGAVLSSDDRLPMALDAPLVLPLPERLGGGFLFVVDGTHVWRADGWLDPARPLFTSRTSFLDTYGRVAGGIVAGLDRVYAWTGSTFRSWEAFDGVSGKALAQGPWPASPAVGSYVALDGWRALAIADLRGLVATFDAGATFHTLHLPIDAHDITVVGDAFEVKGLDEAGNEARYDVRADGQVERAPEARDRILEPDPHAAREAPGLLGPNPLMAAVEDGWPAGDGTALVARDGALSRVRLDDGTVVETAPEAYDLRPSRCHPVPFGAAGGVGFVCGESRGATEIYRFDPSAGRMLLVRRFDTPRAVLASGNGGLAVRGPCDATLAYDAPGSARRYCVSSASGLRANDSVWREIRLEGATGAERVVVLGDGRVAVLSPPEGNLSAARLTVVQGGHPTVVPLGFTAFTRVSPDVQRVLDAGVWLDGFEERRAGVLGGWIEAAGTMLGVEIDLAGRVRFGQYIRDAGKTMVSGRYGLGWTPSLLGLETTDGGMTWAQLDVPAPVAPARAITARACGPVGCSAAGWLKIGWGRGPLEPRPPPPPHGAARTGLSVALECEPPPDKTHGAPVDPFGSFPVPAVLSDEELVTNDSPGARVIAWGPKNGDWEHVGRWEVHWVWPFGGAADARTTLASPVPSFLASAARFGVARGLKWSLSPGDDAAHALASVHRKRDELSLFELEADHAPQEIDRADGEPFIELDAAIRANGRWYLATPPRPGGRSETTVWQVEGAIARELARVPRSTDRAHAGLAFRGDGQAIGLVASGGPSVWPTRWILPIDLESGGAGDLEPEGAHDFGDRPGLPVCAHDDPGWLLDVPASFPIRLTSRPSAGATSDSSSVGNPLVRMRLSGAHACIERLSGSLEAPTAAPFAAPFAAPSANEHAGNASLSVTLTSSVGRERRSLRCRTH